MFSYGKKRQSKKPELPTHTKAKREAEEAKRFALLSPQEQEQILKQKALEADINQIKKDVRELPDMNLEELQARGKDLARQLSQLSNTKVYFAQTTGTSNAGISSETFIYSNKNAIACDFFERAQQTASAMGLNNQLIISYNRDNQPRNGCSTEFSKANDGKLAYAILNHLLKSLTMKLTQESSNINSENNNNNQSVTPRPGGA